MAPDTASDVTSPAMDALSVPAAVAKALLSGEQIIDLRAEPPAGGATCFWLVPTSAETDLKPAYRMARELSLSEDPPPAGQVRIAGWAELAGVGTATLDGAGVDALNGKTILALTADGTETVVLALRTHRLAEPMTVPADLSGLPTDPSTVASTPVLSDVAFTARRDGLANALPAGLNWPV